MNINKTLNQGWQEWKFYNLYSITAKTYKWNVLLLLYTAIIRPLFTYSCPEWAVSSQIKITLLQILQNKFLRTALKTLWFMWNKQLQNNN